MCCTHSFVPADGRCSLCGRPFCQTCLSTVDGAPKCQACRNKKPVSATSSVAPSAKTRIDGKMIFSFVILLAGGVLPFVAFGDQIQQGELPSMISSSAWCAYVPWALFWGVPVLWRIGFRAVRNSVPFLLYLNLVSIPIICVCLLLFVIVSSGYSVFGGGIFHFARHWWAVRH